jgi:glutamate-1-semialdehyde 2,1-aminomutase
MLAGGIYLAPSAFEAGFVSATHSTTDITETVTRAAEALKKLAA